VAREGGSRSNEDNDRTLAHSDGGEGRRFGASRRAVARSPEDCRREGADVTPLSAVDQGIMAILGSLGAVLGTAVVLTTGIAVGAVFGTIAGVGYLRWSGSWSDDEPPTEAAEGAATPPDEDGLSLDVPTELPRRQMLGTVAAVGGAAALGGIGTSAFYRDTESFSNNQIVTGELDLKIDWQEHYSDWSPDETNGLTVSMTDDTVGPGFPSAASEKLVYVSDAEQFLANTAVEAFPDEDNDALQDILDDDSDICDLEADLDDALASDLRTEGTFPEGVTEDDRVNPQTTEPGDPLVDVADVKPGDFGEMTFSLHLCGNPGFVWLTGALRDNAENGVIDPEEGAPGEGAGGELADAIQAAVWYDTGEDGTYGADFVDEDAGEGDNFRQTEERLLLRGSLREVLDAVSTGPGLPLDGDPGTGADTGGGTGGTGTGGPGPRISGVVDEDDPEVEDVLVTTEDERFDDQEGGGPPEGAPPKNCDCADYEANLDVGNVDGSEVLTVEDAVTAGESYPGCTTVTVDELSGGSITLSSAGPVKIVSVKGGSSGEQVYVFAIPTVLDGATVSTPDGSGISNVDVCCPDDGGGNGGGGQGDPGRQCLESSTTAYVGFEWWVPRDVGSAIQTDSVSFDLGFYTEQCRHNDGTGFGTPGGGPDDGDGDEDDDGDNGDGTDGVSFLAACVADDRSDIAADVELEASVIDSGPTLVGWSTDDVPVDAMVAYQGGRFTTYTFDESQAAGVVEVGADENGNFDDVDGESPQTTIWRPQQDETEETQRPSDPCPLGYVEGDRIEF
jgi:predicted ribosomally synthesized peptide with SipW-like signal peptide